MPYTKKQCRYFGANPNKAPKDWKQHCTKNAPKKKPSRKKKSK